MNTAFDKTATFLESIKFSHSVFALPFALIAMLVAANGLPGFWVVFWIVAACIAARTAAMSFNRLVDRRFDARNPRTAGRALVTGELSSGFMLSSLVAGALVFFLAAAMLNKTCLYLAAPTLAVLLGYSLTKRFTNFSHFVLGAALGLAPIGAWIAVKESVGLTVLLLSAGVICWVAGFDILYACQDHEFDAKENELHSIPKRLGVPGAMRLARRTHAAAVVLFLLFWLVSGLGFLSLLGVLAVALLMRHQHHLVSPTDLSRIDAAFFTTNGLISIGLFIIVAVDVILC